VKFTSIKGVFILVSIVFSLITVSSIVATDLPTHGEQPYIGTVLHAQTEGNYTYLKLQVEDKEIWIATFPRFLKVSLNAGDKVEYTGGILMKDFESKALKKKFESILFITRIKVLEKNSVSVPVDDVHSASKAEVKILPPDKGEIERAKGGKTIGEIFSEREKLKDKVVILQAKVMKVSKNILKRTWITLQDGTGTSPDDKIVFTTTGIANINDIVTVKGIVRTDVKIGGNYNYKVLLEDVNSSNKQ
jgi:hypothetical protein